MSEAQKPVVKTVQFLAVDAQSVQVRKAYDVALGKGAAGQPLKIKAERSTRYELLDPTSQRAPEKVRAKRSGKHLEIFLEGSTEADIVVEDYYDEALVEFPRDSLTGKLPSGNLGTYVIDEGLYPALTTLSGELTPIVLIENAAWLPHGWMGAAVAVSAAIVSGSDAVAPPTQPTLDNVVTGPLNPSRGHRLTADNTPTIEGTGKAGETIHIRDADGVLIASAVVGADGRWSATVTQAMLDDVYNLSITAVNSAGVVSSPVAFTLEVDATPPDAPVADVDRASDTGTSDSDNITADTTPTISGTGTPGDVITVTMPSTNEVLSVVVDDNGHWDITPTQALAVGVTGDVRVTATDAAGNVSAPTLVPLTIVGDLLITGQVNAGPVSGGVTLLAYDAAGELLGQADIQSDGSYSISALSRGDYRGTVLLRAQDSNARNANYRDEVTNSDKSLDTELRALGIAEIGQSLFSVSGIDSHLIINISPLTEIAVRQAGVSGNTPVDVATAQTANTNVASAFGLAGVNITGGVTTTNSASFDARNGLTDAEKYGLALTKLSGLDSLNAGSMATSLDVLAANLNGNTLTPAGAALVDQGREQALNNLKSANTTFNAGQGDTDVNTALNRQLLGEIMVTSQDLDPQGRLVVSGTALPGATLTITLPDGSTQTTVVDADGNFSLTSAGAQPSLDTPVQVRGVDALSAPVANAAPNAPGIDTGNGKLVTGSGDPGTTVTVRNAQGDVIGSATVDALGHWSLTPSTPLPNATGLRATAVDAAGNASGPGAGITDINALVIDVPEASDGYVSAAEKASGGGVPITVSLPANAAVGDLIRSTITLPDGSQLNLTRVLDAADVALGSISQLMGPAQLPIDGLYQVSSTRTNAQGTSAPSVREFVLDTTVPAAPEIAPSNGQIITGTAEPGTTVTVRDGQGNVIGTAGPVGPGGNWTLVPAAPLADGAAITATATDPAGNTSGPGAGEVDVGALLITGAIDNLGPRTGLLGDGAYTNDSSPLLTGTLGTPLADGQTLAIYREGVWVGNAVVNGNTWSFQDGATTPLADAPYAYEAKVLQGSQIVQTSGVFNLIVDNAPSTPGVFIPDAAQGVSTAEALDGVALRITLPQDATVGDIVTTVITLPDGVTTLTRTTVLTEAMVTVGTIVHTVTNAELGGPVAGQYLDGDWTTATTITDAAGNTCDPQLDGFRLAANAPSLLLNTIAGDNVVNAAEKAGDVLVSGTTSVEPGQAVTITLVDANNLPIGTYHTTVQPDGTFALNIPQADLPADGTYTVQANASNSAGTPAVQASQNLLFDTVAPVVTVGSVAGDSVGASGSGTFNAAERGFDANTYALSDTVTVLPVISGTTDAEAGQTVTVVLNGMAHTTTVQAGGTWAVTLDQDSAKALVHGTTYDITVSVHDVAGNPAVPDTNNQLVVDIAPPDVPTIDQQYASSLTPVITGGAQKLSNGNPIALADGDSLRFTLNGVTVTATVDSGQASGTSLPGVSYNPTNRTWSLDTATAGSFGLADGSTYNVEVSVTAAGVPARNDVSTGELSLNTAPPSITLDPISPDAAGDSVINGFEQNQSLTLTGTTDAEVGQTVTLTDLDGTTRTALVMPGANGGPNTFSFSVPGSAVAGLADGTLIPQVSVTNLYGLSGTDTETLLVDTTAPSVPAVALPESASGVNAAEAASASGTPLDVTLPQDAAPGDTVTTLVTKADGSTLVLTRELTVADVTAGSISQIIPTAELNVDGGWTTSTTITDPAGNRSPAASGAFSLDTQAPGAPGVRLPEADHGVNAAEAASVGGTPLNISLPGNAAVGDTVVTVVTLPDGSTLSLSTVLTVAHIAAGEIDHIIPTSELDVDGQWTTSTTITDLAGNVGEARTGGFVLDTTAPAAPVADVATASDTGASNTDNNTSDNTPTISGTGTPGDTITVTFPGGEVQQAVVAADGSWSVTPEDELPDGAQTVTVVATDPVGNSSPTTEVPLVIDTTAPATPTVNPLTTSDSTPVLTGTATVTVGAGETLQVTVNGATYNVTVNASGTWSLDTGTATPVSGTLGAFVSGTSYPVTATVTDTAGNASSDSSTNELAFDNTAPALPTVDALTTNNTSPVITGTATLGAGETLQVSVNGATYDVPVNPDGTWSVDTATATPASGTLAAFVDGTSYPVTATVTDGANNSTTDTSTNELVIDTTAPNAPAADVAAQSDTGSSNTDNITRDNTPTIAGSGATPGDTITVTMPGTNEVLTVVVAADGSWSVTPSQPLTDGAADVSVTATDPAGNTSSPTLVSLVIDTTAPDAPIARLDDSSNSGLTSDNVTNDNTPLLAGSATPGDTITVMDAQGNTLGTALVDSNGNWSLQTTTALPNGLVNFQITATDPAGNTSPRTTLPVVIDAVVAEPEINPTNGQGDITGAGEIGAMVTLRDAGNNVIGSALVDANGNWAITPAAPVANGTGLSAIQTDVAGNTSDPAASTVDNNVPNINPTNGTLITGTGKPGSTIALTLADGTPIRDASGAPLVVPVDGNGNWTATPGTPLPNGAIVRATDPSNGLSDTEPVDAQAPASPIGDVAAASDSGLSNTDNITNVTTPDIVGTGTPGDTIRLYAPNGVTLLGSAVVAPDGSWSITPPSPLPQGLNNLRVTATDPVGNTSAPSTVPVTIDTTAPAAPVADIAASSDSGSSNTDNITSDNTPTISGTGTPGNRITVTMPGTNEVLTATVDSNGNWSVTPTQALPDGVADISVIATDPAGNNSPATLVPVTIDTTAPTPPVVDNLSTADLTPTITGSATLALGDSMQVTVNGATYQVTPDAFGNWSIDTATATPVAGTLGAFVNGQSYNVVATITDAAGNTASDTSVGELAIDTSLPPSPDAPDLTAASDLGTSDTDNVTRDTTPSFAVTTPPAGSTPVLFIDGVEVAATYDPNTGTLTPNTPLGDGTYSISYAFEDGNNVQGPRSPALTIAIDTAVPARPAAPDLTTATDSGASSTDNLTNDTTPDFAVTAPPAGGTVVLLVDGAPVAATYNPLTGTVTPNSPLAQGAQAISYQVLDAAGNASPPSAALNITIDSVAPATPAAPDMTAATDSGSSNSDDITRDNTPTFDVTAPPANGEVRLYVDGVLTPALYSNGQIIPQLPLPDGDHTITYVVVDAAGNASDPSPGLDITIDTAAAGTPSVAIPEAAGNVDATEAADGVQLTVTIPADAQVGDVISTVVTSPSGSQTTLTTTLTAADLPPEQGGTASGSGPFTVTQTVPQLTLNGGNAAYLDGNWTTSTRVIDAAGNVSPADSDGFVLAANVPTISLGTVAGDNTINAAEASGDVAISGTTQYVEPGQTVTVRLMGGATVVGTYTATVQPGGGFTLHIPSAGIPANGSYTLTADVSNALAVPAVQAQRPVAVDTTAPTITVTSVSQDSVSGAQNGTFDASERGALNSPTVTTKPVVSGTTDAEVGQTVTVSLNGIQYTTTVQAGGTWSVQLSDADAIALNHGSTYAITASVIDLAGNLGSDTDNGMAVNIAPPDTPTVVEQYTGNHTPTITGQAQKVDPNDANNFINLAAGDTLVVGVNGIVYTLIVGGTSTGVVTSDSSATAGGELTYSNGTWSLVPTATIPNGDHEVAVSVTAAGVTKTDISAVELHINDVAPSITLNPISGGTLNAAESTQALPISGTTDAPVGATVTVNIGGQNYTALVQAGASGQPNTFTVTVPGADVDAIADGSQTVTASVTNRYGVTGTDDESLIVDTGVPAAPVGDVAAADDTGASNTDNITSEVRPDITGTAEPGATVRLYADDGSTVLGSAVADGSGNWTITPNADLIEGLNNLVATATDAAGNVSPPASVPVTVDTTAPSAPTVDSNSTGDTTPVITGTANVMAGETLRVVVNGATYTVTVAANGTWALDTQNATPISGTLGAFVPGQTYNVTATVVDAAGNSTSDTSSGELSIVAVTLIGELASASDSGVLGDNRTNDTTPTISGQGLPGETIKLYAPDGTTLLGQTVVQADGSWSITPSAPLAEGLHNLSITSTAPNGTVTGPAGISVVIDTTASLTVTSVAGDAVPATGSTGLDGTFSLLERGYDTNTYTLNSQVTTLPVIQGVTDAEAGSTVTLTLNSRTYSVTVVSGGGIAGQPNSWSHTLSDADAKLLNHGNRYAITTSVSDTAGNTATDNNNGVLVNIAPPDVPVVFNQFNLQTRTPTITGTAHKLDNSNNVINLANGDTLTVVLKTADGTVINTYSLTVGSTTAPSTVSANVTTNGELRFDKTTGEWTLGLPLTGTGAGVPALPGAGFYNVDVTTSVADGQGGTVTRSDISSQEISLQPTAPTINATLWAATGAGNTSSLTGVGEANYAVSYNTTANAFVSSGTADGVLWNSEFIGMGTVVRVQLPTTGGVPPVAGNTVRLSWGGVDIDVTLTSAMITAKYVDVTVPEATIRSVGYGDVNVTAQIIGGGIASALASQSVKVAFDLPLALPADPTSASYGYVINGAGPGATVVSLNNNRDASGSNVSFMGDLNGDGYDDVAIGDAYNKKIYVVWGHSGHSATNLSSVSAGANGFTATMNTANGGVTDSYFDVTSADYNGDGLNDLMISASPASADLRNASAYVFYGQSSANTSFSNGGLATASQGFKIADGNGTTSFATLGSKIIYDTSSSSGFRSPYGGGVPTNIGLIGAGDVNGDGYEDYIVGQMARAHVVFGNSDGSANFDLPDNSANPTSASYGFIIKAHDALGYWGAVNVGGGGDINGDGLDDLVIGGETYNGVTAAVNVVFGKASNDTVNQSQLTAASNTLGFRITEAGQTVSSAGGGLGAIDSKASVQVLGDVNGDGLADIAVAQFDRAVVVFGKADGSTVSASAIAAGTSSSGFAIQGDAATMGSFGFMLNAGDMNGDGLSDMVIQTSGSKAYLVFGQTAGAQVIQLSDPDITKFVPITNEGGSSGQTSISAAGDVNGDGFDDLIIGISLADTTSPNVGRSYIVYGGMSDVTDFVFQASRGDAIGTTGADTLAGTSGNNQLVGGDGNDRIVGNGGADVMYGGRGDDTLVLNADNAAMLARNSGNTSQNIARINGGNGIDTIELDSASLDLTQVRNAAIDGIERFNLNGNGSSLTLNTIAVIDLSKDNNAFNTANGWTATSSGGATSWGATNRYAQAVVDGDATNTLTLRQGWTNIGNVEHTEGGVTTVYKVLQSNSAAAQVLVANNVQLRMSPSVLTSANELASGLNHTEALSGSGTPVRVSLADTGAVAGNTLELNWGGQIVTYTVTAQDVANGYADVQVGTSALTAVTPVGTTGNVAVSVTLLDGADTVSQSDPASVAVNFLLPTAPTINATLWAATGAANSSSLTGVGEANYAADSTSFVTTGAVDGVLWNSEFIGNGTVVRVQLPTTGTVPPVAGDTVRLNWGGTDLADVTLTSAMITAKYVDITVSEATIRTAGYGDVDVTAQIFKAATGNGSLLASQAVTVAFDLPLALPADPTSPSYGFVVNGAGPNATVFGINNTRDAFGSGATNMGDMNGDGLDDYMVGDNINAKMYVVFGQSDMSGVNISSVTSGGTGGFIISAATDATSYGYDKYSLMASADFNGDGLNDVAMALNNKNADGRASELFVVYGKTDTATVNLYSMTVNQGFKVNSAPLVSGHSYSGFGSKTIQYGTTIYQTGSGSTTNNIGLTSAGDVNGDGFEDFIAGMNAANIGTATPQTGRAFVLFGTSSPVSNFILPYMSTSYNATLTNGFFIEGNNSVGVATGTAVGGGGDVNGDGLDDLVVSSNATTTVPASVFVVYGKNDGTAVNISSLTGNAVTGGFRITDAAQTVSSTGAALVVPTGRTPSAQVLGDVNGDGLADIAVGQYDRAVVVFGKNDTTAVSASAIAAGSSTQGFVIQGDSAKTGAFGFMVNAGDMNGDGLADMVVATGSNHAYIVFGQTAGGVTIDLTRPDITKFVPVANEVGSNAQSVISSVGDVNGDGFDDIVIGVPSADPASGANEGKSYVVYGGFSDVTSAVFQVSNGDVIGTSGNDTINGTSAANQLVGGLGDDVFTGNGGADVMYGGAGDDTFVLNADNVAMLARNSGNTSQNIARINGGNGIDTIKLDGTSSLDLTQVQNAVIDGVERFNLNGNSSSLTLGLVDVIQLSQDNNAFNTANGWTATSSGGATGWDAVNRYAQAVVDGDATNTLTLRQGWTNIGNVEHTEGGVTTVYKVLQSNSAAAQVLVANNVQLRMSPSVLTSANELASGLNHTEALSGSGTPVRVSLADTGAVAGNTLELNWGGQIVSYTVTAQDISNGYADVLVGTSALTAVTPVGTTGNVAVSVALMDGATALSQSDALNVAVDFVLPDAPAITSAAWTSTVASDTSGIPEMKYEVLFTPPASGVVVPTTGTLDGYITTTEAYKNGGTTVRVAFNKSADTTAASAGDTLTLVVGDATPITYTLTTADITNGAVLITVDTATLTALPVGTDIPVSAYITSATTGNISPSITVNIQTRYEVPLEWIGLGNTAVTPPGFVLSGASASQFFGCSVSSAGDVNGDGLEDFIVGAYLSSPQGAASGRAYVIYGRTDAGPLNLTAIEAGSGGFVINGNSADARVGRSVSAAGDINGDGLADIFVGAPANALGANGAAYVIYGNSNSVSPVNLSNLATNQGFKISGDATLGYVGNTVSSAGDFNGDGFDDLLTTGTIILGSASTGNINLATATNVFKIAGISSSGITPTSFGDFNGDGLDDVVMAMPTSGKTYVVFGKTDSNAITLDASKNLSNASMGFTITGAAATGGDGHRTTMLGDVNGDGLADVGIQSQAGLYSYVVFGNSSNASFTLSNLSSASPTGGFAIKGVSGNFNAIASAGDMNGDGLNDIFITNIQDKPYGLAHGGGYVIFGRTGSSIVDVNTMAASDGFRILGWSGATAWGAASDRGTISTAGDINGDGFDDLVIGAHGLTVNGNASAGQTYVVYGGASEYTSLVFDSANGDAIGTTGNDTLGDTTANRNNQFNGGLGNDTITGNGGADVMYGGAGNDTFVLNTDNVAMLARNTGNTSQNIARVDGGIGMDTLKLDGTGITLDLTTIRSDVVSQVENLDISGSGSNTLKLTATDVLDMGDNNLFNVNPSAIDTRKQLMVTADADDKVVLTDLTDWTLATGANSTFTSNGHTYDVYNHNTKALQLLIDHAILQSNITMV